MIVAAYKSPLGTVYINDEAYRDVPPQEMQRRRERAEQLAWDIAVKLTQEGVEIRWPEGLPEIHRLDMKDPEVIREIQEYEKMRDAHAAGWARKGKKHGQSDNQRPAENPGADH